MPSIPKGSIVFSGFGDAPVRFTTPTGTILASPDSAPVCGEGGASSFKQASDGKSVCSGVGMGGAYSDASWVVFNNDFTVGHADGTQDPQPVNGMYIVGSNVYMLWVDLVAVSTWELKLSKLTTSGALVSTVTLIGPTGTFGDVLYSDVLAVSQDETTVYIAKRGNPRLRKFSIGGAALGDFVDMTGSYNIYDAGVLTMANGDVLIACDRIFPATTLSVVRRYNSSGVLQQTYSLPDHLTSRSGMAHAVNVSDSGTVVGISQTEFYVSMGSNNGPYGTSIVRLNIATGAELSRFDTPDDGFQYDGPFFVLRTSFGTTVPIDTPDAPKIDCAPQTEVGSGGRGAAGCNTGGVGFLPANDYSPGVIPEHDDPETGELVSGKVGLEVWVELVHEGTTYRRAMVPLSDRLEGGYKAPGLVSVGMIEHALGNERGGYEPATIDVELSDTFDNLIRGIIGDDEEVEGDELRVKIASDELRGLL